MAADWIKSVLICSILFSVVVYIAPNPRMRRYVQTAVGFVMIIVVMSPVLSAMKCEDRLAFNLYEESLGTWISDGDDEVYIAAMEQVVDTYLHDNWGIEADVDIDITEELAIKSMTVHIDYTYMSSVEDINSTFIRSVSRGLSREYGIDEGRIIIM